MSETKKYLLEVTVDLLDAADPLTPAVLANGIAYDLAMQEGDSPIRWKTVKVKGLAELKD